MIMQNKPNFQNFQMVISLVNTRNYNNEQRTMNYSKQTQSNPILSASGGFKMHTYSGQGEKGPACGGNGVGL